MPLTTGRPHWRIGALENAIEHIATGHHGDRQAVPAWDVAGSPTHGEGVPTL
ncbi:hypothetical protein ACWDWU_01145 [Streptomyces sp. NPDC003442]